MDTDLLKQVTSILSTLNSLQTPMALPTKEVLPSTGLRMDFNNSQVTITVPIRWAKDLKCTTSMRRKLMEYADDVWTAAATSTTTLCSTEATEAAGGGLSPNLSFLHVCLQYSPATSTSDASDRCCLFLCEEGCECCAECCEMLHGNVMIVSPSHPLAPSHII